MFPLPIIGLWLVLGFFLEMVSICLSVVYLSARTPKARVAWAAASIALGWTAWNVYEASFFMEPMRIGLVLMWTWTRGGRGLLSLMRALLAFWPWWVVDAGFLGDQVFFAATNQMISDALSKVSAEPGAGLLRTGVGWINALVFAWLFPPLASSLESTPLQVIAGMLVGGLGALAWVLCAWRHGLRQGTPAPDRAPAGPLELFWPGLVLAAAAGGILIYSLRGGLGLQMPQPQLVVGACLAAALAAGWWRDRRQGLPASWAWQWIILGAAVSLLCLLLMGVANRHPVLYNLRDHWYLSSMAGACLFVVGALGLLRNGNLRVGLVALLLALGLLFHFGNGSRFWEDWKYQRSLAWQLWERAPRIEPGTILVLDPGVQANRQTFKYYSVFGLTSSLYSLTKPEDHLGQAILGVGKDKAAIEGLTSAEKTLQGARKTLVPVDWSKALVLSLADSKSCLYVADRRDPVMPQGVMPLARQLAGYSNLDLIKDQRGPNPPRSIFGDQPCDWCTYYQRAQLARQYGRWQAVVDIYAEAKSKGLAPNRVEELLPFIEGMLKTGRRDLAEPLAAAVRAQHGSYAQLEALMSQAGR
jgi:hypothetical protein